MDEPVMLAGILYAIGVCTVLLGGLLVAPTLSRIAQVSDPIMLLAAPIVMNGVWLLIFGVLLCAAARIIQLLNRIPQIRSYKRDR
jgi:hypothetical protein